MMELLGAPVANAVCETLRADVEALRFRGVSPRLAIVRVGERDADLSYQRGATKRMEKVGIDVEVCALRVDASQEDLERALTELDARDDVHGILLMRPLPAHMDEARARELVSAAKDVDGMCAVNVAKVAEGDMDGFAPCTPEAVVTLLDHYGIAIDGSRVCVIGRGSVVGRPLASLLLARNATVTLCHSHTRDVAEETRGADIVVAAVGSPRFVNARMVTLGATVIDVGINVDEDGHLCGDVESDSVRDVAGALTPVPRGVGSVTTSILAAHVVRAARNA